MRCRDCCSTLKAYERKYYEDRCEQCERDHLDRVGAWMAGGDDPELDSTYEILKPDVH